MATFGPSLIASFATDADLSGMAYRIVKTSASGVVTNTTAATDIMIGVLTDGVADGSAEPQGVSVAISGIAKIKAGGVVAVGDQLTSNGDGRAIAAAGGNSIIGRALSAASGADEVIDCLLIPGLKHV